MTRGSTLFPILWLVLVVCAATYWLYPIPIAFSDFTSTPMANHKREVGVRLTHAKTGDPLADIPVAFSIGFAPSENVTTVRTTDDG